MNNNTHDGYGFPLVYEKTALALMQAKISLPAETIELIRRYFAAAANLYARIPLQKLYDIYISQNAHISEADFLQVTELISHEHHYYAILGHEVFWEDAEPSQPIDRELVASHLYEMGYDYYYETEAQQEGIKYYIPSKEELLKYADEWYIEWTPQVAAVERYLRYSQRKLHCPIADVIDDLHLAMTMGNDYAAMVTDARRLGVRFDNEQSLRTFLRLLMDMCRHTRQFARRGHTPEECHAPTEDMDLIAAGIEYKGEYEDGLTRSAKLLRTAFDEPRSNTLSGAPSKNAFCPCGSGRKYKNCCGKGDKLRPTFDQRSLSKTNKLV
jgi:hypothetical protein